MSHIICHICIIDVFWCCISDFIANDNLWSFKCRKTLSVSRDRRREGVLWIVKIIKLGSYLSCWSSKNWNNKWVIWLKVFENYKTKWLLQYFFPVSKINCLRTITSAILLLQSQTREIISNNTQSKKVNFNYWKIFRTRFSDGTRIRNRTKSNCEQRRC